MDKKAHSALRKQAKLHGYGSVYELISKNGQLKLETAASKSSLFEYLIKTVTGQQLSKKAATSIFNRIVDLSTENKTDLYNLIDEKNSEALLSCGVSRNKVKAMVSLKTAFLDGVLSESMRGSDRNHIHTAITSVWGYGNWSADMTVMSYFCYPDIWSEDDVTLRKGVEKLVGVTDVEACNSVVEHFSPYRSYLALHIWKGVDDGLIV